MRDKETVLLGLPIYMFTKHIKDVAVSQCLSLNKREKEITASHKNYVYNV